MELAAPPESFCNDSSFHERILQDALSDMNMWRSSAVALIASVEAHTYILGRIISALGSHCGILECLSIHVARPRSFSQDDIANQQYHDEVQAGSYHKYSYASDWLTLLRRL